LRGGLRTSVVLEKGENSFVILWGWGGEVGRGRKMASFAGIVVSVLFMSLWGRGGSCAESWVGGKGVTCGRGKLALLKGGV